MAQTTQHPLSLKHRTFLDNWLETGNITQSAIKAGYSAKTAGAKGCNLLKDPRSKEYLEAMKIKMMEHKENSIANTAELAEYLTKVVRGEIRDTFRGEEIPISIAERTKAAVELSKLVNVATPTTEKVVIIDGITRDTE